MRQEYDKKNYLGSDEEVAPFPQNNNKLPYVNTAYGRLWVIIGRTVFNFRFIFLRTNILRTQNYLNFCLTHILNN